MTHALDADEAFMRVALDEARKGLGHTSPNPAVGAILVAGNRVIARGHHRKAGCEHAEVECLRDRTKAKRANATLYVTLEPCSTTGRTPPCTQAIIDSGVKNVVVGAIDPNPKHAGRGIKLLRKAGVSVRVGVMATECADINAAFNKWIQTKRPLVIAKCGMTLDGRLTRPPKEDRWITSAVARKHANRRRAEVDAILIGAETLRADNPRLTVREVRGARQPWRIVLSGSGKIPRSARLFTDRFADRTLLIRKKPLEAVLDDLGQREITSVLIEGGGDVLGQALDARLIDRVQIYIAPLLSGGPVLAFAGRGAESTSQAMRLQDLRYQKIGDEIFIEGKATFGAISPE